MNHFLKYLSIVCLICLIAACKTAPSIFHACIDDKESHEDCRECAGDIHDVCMEECGHLAPCTEKCEVDFNICKGKPSEDDICLRDSLSIGDCKACTSNNMAKCTLNCEGLLDCNHICISAKIDYDERCERRWNGPPTA